MTTVSDGFPDTVSSSFQFSPTDGPILPASSTTNSTTLRLVATIVPIIIIVAITIWGLLVAGGVMHHRRSRYDTGSADSLPSSTYSEKWPEGLQEPKLWEVRLGNAPQRGLEDKGNPLSVEMQDELPSLSYSKGRRHSLKKGHEGIDVKSKRRWMTFKSVSHPETSAQPAQLNVLVAMPSPRRRHNTLECCAIGTRQVIYTSEETKPPGIEPMHEQNQQQDIGDPLIHTEMTTHGYIA